MKYIINQQENTVIGVTSKGYTFLIDSEDLEKVQQYTWNKHNKGYFFAWDGKQKKNIYLHRFIMNVHEENKNSNNYVDHISGCKKDNRKANLRLCTNAENLQNRKLNSNNTSGAKGVSWHKSSDKWQVKINVNEKQKLVGYYTEIKEAIKARLEAEQTYYTFLTGGAE